MIEMEVDGWPVVIDLDAGYAYYGFDFNEEYTVRFRSGDWEELNFRGWTIRDNGWDNILPLPFRLYLRAPPTN